MALFKRIFGAQSPQLSKKELDRFVVSFALNRAAKNVSLRQFRQVLEPGFFDGFDALWVKLSQSVPCRVLWGDDDPYISAQYAHRFGVAHVTILPGVGHWVPLIASKELAAEVEAIG
jgi:pimeloyl-ACP methyl ester carboxylesterase